MIKTSPTVAWSSSDALSKVSHGDIDGDSDITIGGVERYTCPNDAFDSGSDVSQEHGHVSRVERCVRREVVHQAVQHNVLCRTIN